MKVEKKQDLSFKPVQVTLTFETPEELEAMNELLLRDLSVPDLIFSGNRKMEDVLFSMMNKMYNGMFRT